MMVIDIPKIILLSIIFVFIAGALLLERMFLKRIEQKHHETWINLGEPSFFLETSSEVQKKLKVFENSKKYLELNDSELNKIANWRDKFGAISNVYFVLLTILFIVVQFIK